LLAVVAAALVIHMVTVVAVARAGIYIDLAFQLHHKVTLLRSAAAGREH
jgi:hypothetical protein